VALDDRGDPFELRLGGGAVAIVEAAPRRLEPQAGDHP
jgi:hypothetical protein